MGYIDKNLIADETIIFRTKKSLIIFVTPLIWIIATGFFYFNPNPYVVKTAILPAIVGLISVLNTLLVYITSDFAVTNKRVMMKEGFFFRHANETRLTTIASVSINQSLLGQLLNYGTVTISPFGGNMDSFTDIAAPIVFQKKAQEQLQ